MENDKIFTQRHKATEYLKINRFLKIENLTDFQYFKNEVFKISEHKRGDLKINRFLKIENLTDFQYNSFASWCEKPMKNIYFIEY